MIEKGLSSFFNRFQLSPNRKKVAKNLYWAVIGKMVSVLGELLVGVFVARTLGPEQFGLMNYVISYVMIFSVISRFGLDGIEVRELSKPETNRGELLGTALGLRFIFSGVTYILIALSLWRFEANHMTRTLIYIYAGSVFFGSFAVFRNYFTSVIQHEHVVKSEIFRTVLGEIIKLLVLWKRPELVWILGAFAFDTVLLGIGYAGTFRKRADPGIGRWSFNLDMAGVLVRNAFPLLLSALAIVLYQKINTVLIRNMLDEASLGYYAVAAKVVDFSVFIPAILAQSVAPMLVKAHSENYEAYLHKRQVFMNWMFWCGTALSITLFLTAPYVIKILYGDAYSMSHTTLRILAWKLMFSSWLLATGEIIVIENLQKYAVFRNIVGAAISISGNLLLIPVWGITGSALVLVTSVFATGFISNLLIPRYRFLTTMQIRTFSNPFNHT